MTDGTRRKITMPAWHMPYLEKHRIFELFHELARELVIQQPEDHVLFLKQILAQAARNRDVARVILICSQRINVIEVGNQICQQTEQVLITENMVLKELEHFPTARENVRPKQLVAALKKVVLSRLVADRGWVLVDVIKNKVEAEAILEAGILPTHVLHLISPYAPKLTNLLYCNVLESWPEYRRTIIGIREAFKKKLIEVYLHQFLIYDVVEKCVNLIKISKIQNGPTQPRLLILGPRGSGRKTQAKLLEERLGLVHVDYEYLLCQAWISESELGEKLRACEDTACFQSNILNDILNKRLLDEDCLTRGWTLTGFPFTVSDFKYLDCLETPPNRVVFLECDLNICRERLVYRKVNAYTGSMNNLEENESTVIQENKILNQHPKDNEKLVDAELGFYCNQYGALRKYCGRTSDVVNGDQPERWVFECISAIIVRDMSACPPRDPFVKDSNKEAEKSKTVIDVTPSMIYNTYKADLVPCNII